MMHQLYMEHGRLEKIPIRTMFKKKKKKRRGSHLILTHKYT